MSTLGDRGEAEAAGRIIFEDVAGYDRNSLFVNGSRELDEHMQHKIDAVVEKIEQGSPVQYAVGRARFMGMDFIVNPDVLIPRFETEQLVDAVTAKADGRTDLTVLDIGTGSGCIAIALARALPFCRVKAIDVSDKALAVAEANARALKAHVTFSRADALRLDTPASPFADFIVSNPPYVLESERAGIDKLVKDYEPALALFVPDENPLLYHTAITTYAVDALLPGGWLCFEANSRYIRDVMLLMERCDFCDIESRRDYRGNPRFVFGRKRHE